jgi:hypothetical protein
MAGAGNPFSKQEEDIGIVFRFVSIPVSSTPPSPRRVSPSVFLLRIEPAITRPPTRAVNIDPDQNHHNIFLLHHGYEKPRALRPPNMSNLERTFVSKADPTGDHHRELSKHVHCHTSYNIILFQRDLNYLNVCLIVSIDFRYFGGSVYILCKDAVMAFVRMRWIRDLLRLRGTC